MNLPITNTTISSSNIKTHPSSKIQLQIIIDFHLPKAVAIGPADKAPIVAPTVVINYTRVYNRA